MNRSVHTKFGIGDQEKEVSSLHPESITIGTADQVHTEIIEGYYYFTKYLSKYNFHSYDCYFYARKVCCKFCSKSFSKRCNLNTHIRIEHDKQRYKCMKCDKLFKSAYALKKHANNSLVHKEKGSRSRRVDTESSKTVSKEDADFGLPADDKNKLILKFRERITKLKTCNDKYRSDIMKYKNEIKTLLLFKTKFNRL